MAGELSVLASPEEGVATNRAYWILSKIIGLS
jgi:hypothetical protein